MKQMLFVLLIAGTSKHILAQNCNAYLWLGDTAKYQACLVEKETYQYYQYDHRFQEGLDRVLAIDSTYAQAWSNKATAFLKSGDMLGYEHLMQKAVQYEPNEYLGVRGWCRYSFFRDYTGALADFYALKERTGNWNGYSVDGEYHFQVAVGLCFKGLGDYAKAIGYIQSYVDSTGDFGLYNALHLGVCYLDIGETDRAIYYLEKQEQVFPFGDTQYYLAKAYVSINNIKAAQDALAIARQRFTQKGNFMFNYYNRHMDKVFPPQVEKLLDQLQ